MAGNAESGLDAYLRRVEGRMRVVRVVRRVGVVAFCALVGLSVLGFVRVANGGTPVTLEIASLAGGMVFVWAVVLLLGTRVEHLAAAREVDARTGGADVVVTAASLGRGSRDPFAVVVRRRAEAHVGGQRVEHVIPWKWPQAVRWSVVPVVGLIGLFGYYGVLRERTAGDQLSAAAVLANAADVVESVGREQLAEVAEELRSQVEVLRESLVADPREEALRRLAEAQAAVERSAAGASEAGGTAEGTNRTEAAAAGSAGEPDAPLVTGMSAEDGGRPDAGGENGKSDAAARPMSAREVADLQSRLEEMKRNLRDREGGGDDGGESGGESGTRLMAAGGEAPGEGEQPGGGAAAPPDGDGEGGGRDYGTVPLTGDDGIGGAVTGADDVAGIETDAGAAVSVGVISADGAGSAGRDYREAYGEAVRAAEEAVDREQLPYGSRELVRRYFEGIRPE